MTETPDSPRARPDWTFLAVDALEKVFPDERPRATAGLELRGFLRERLSAQIAFLPPLTRDLRSVAPLKFRVEGVLASHVRLSFVEPVPVMLAAFEGHDDGYLRSSPGLYPDLLHPLEAGGSIPPAIGSWRAVWIDLEIDDPDLAGTHVLDIVVTDDRSDELVHRLQVPVTIYPVALPDLDIVNTHWVHPDCLADYYGVTVLGEQHWQLIDACLESAAQMRVNSVLTPTWTPPLDTAVGGTRTPVQLIGITDHGQGYEFSFDQLDRWLSLCARHGMQNIEIAHLFTQWGARATPAIYVDTPSGLEQRFGWHVPATDPSYRELLSELLPRLREHLTAHWRGTVMFHLSDEPAADMLEDYRRARDVVADLLEGATIADALSDITFVREGVVQTPIVATDHVQPFLDSGISPWVYYCVGQDRDVANRFIAMPSLRNRVLGRQLFSAGAPGFLHWGFNFWMTQESRRQVDPFRDTCAGGAFLAGDAFVVYPGPDGALWPSIRHRVFAQGMDDHRALQLLRDLTDTATARSLIDQDGGLRYDAFSYDPEHYLRTRREVDDRILAEIGKRT